jgi:hypothetical protein
MDHLFAAAAALAAAPFVQFITIASAVALWVVARSDRRHRRH